MVVNSKPIAIFDSGLGGLTVASEIRRQLPNENIVFLGDMARVPYASLSTPLIEKYASECFQFLAEVNPKILVIACNTVSAICLPHVAKNYDFPILGVIEPTARQAIKASLSKKIGVIATKATIRRKAYEMAFEKLGANVKTTSNACPLLVPLVEEGWIDGEVPQKVVCHYLEPIIAANVDTLVMGCTHYEYFRNLFQSILGDKVHLVNTPKASTNELIALLKSANSLENSNQKGKVKIYSSDLTETLDHVVVDLFKEDFSEDKISVHHANIRINSKQINKNALSER